MSVVKEEVASFFSPPTLEHKAGRWYIVWRLNSCLNFHTQVIHKKVSNTQDTVAPESMRAVH